MRLLTKSKMILELLQDIKKACYILTDLKLIDFDRDQLDTPEDFESLLFPCVLVSVPSIDWDELPHGNQTGDCVFATKTVVKMPQNTAFYLGSEYKNEHLEPLNSENLNALLIEDAVHQEIIKISSVTRTSTKEYAINLAGSHLWVVEHTYSLAAYYENTPRYQRKTTATNPGINIILENQ
jgi:hypothetical protein